MLWHGSVTAKHIRLLNAVGARNARGKKIHAGTPLVVVQVCVALCHLLISMQLGVIINVMELDPTTINLYQPSSIVYVQ